MVTKCVDYWQVAHRLRVGCAQAARRLRIKKTRYRLVTVLCMTSFPPPFGEKQIRYGHLSSLDCHQLYIAIVANASVRDRPSSAVSQCRNLCQYREVFILYDITKFHRPLCRNSVIFEFWRPQRRHS